MLVTLETGKLLQEGLRRSAGDDRHLRLRRRALAPAPRTHHRVGAAGPPDARNLASVWIVRRHLRVQLSGRGVGMERGAGARVRQRGGMEALGEDAAVGVGRPRAAAADASGVRSFADRRRAARDRRPRARAHCSSSIRTSRLISATGSTAMGRAVGEACARQFKRTILELGGNNAAIVCPSADVDLAARAIVFAAVGTAGQRCTTLRRLFVQRDLHRVVRRSVARHLRQHPHRRSARGRDVGRSADRPSRLRSDGQDAGRGRGRRRPKVRR